MTIDGTRYKVCLGHGGAGLFEGSEYLKSVTFAPGVAFVNGLGLFFNCGALTTVDASGLDLSAWNATSVRGYNSNADDDNDKEGGWTFAFRNILSIAGNGKVEAKNSPVPADGAGGPLYVGFDITGNYGVLLEDTMDRVYCLNHWRDYPAGHLYTLETEKLDEAGFAKLMQVTEVDANN